MIWNMVIEFMKVIEINIMRKFDEMLKRFSVEGRMLMVDLLVEMR